MRELERYMYEGRTWECVSFIVVSVEELLFHCVPPSLQVFEEGVKAIPLSVDLWLHYVSFAIACYKDTSQGEDLIRRFGALC